jgi:hypothetical protein
MQPPFLHGPSSLRREIVLYFQQAIPRAITYAKAQWPGDPFLAAPQVWSEYEPNAISHRTGPLFGVGIQSSNGSKHTDFSPAMENELLTTYGVRLYLWCLTPETDSELVPDDAREETLRMRDDMSTLIRSVLWENPGLHLPDRLSVDLRTIREDFSDAAPTPNSSGRYIAAVVVSFSLEVEESLFRPVLGFVSTEGDPNPGVKIEDPTNRGTQNGLE